jgi:hypothetical protein
MNNIFKTLATAIGGFAPTLATMLGGPLAGTAVTALEAALGLAPRSGAAAITEVLQTGAMTPETIAAVRAADQKHAEIMGQQGIDLAKLNADHDTAFAQTEAADRDSARKLQIAQPSMVPATLSVAVTIGFFGVIGLMMAGVDATDNQAFLILLGSLGTGWTTVLAYWFGTTRSSSDKNVLLAQSMPAAGAPPALQTAKG